MLLPFVCPKYFVLIIFNNASRLSVLEPSQQMSALEPRSSPGSAGPVGPQDSSLNPVHREVVVGTGWHFGGLEGKHQGTPLLLGVAHRAPADGSG